MFRKKKESTILEIVEEKAPKDVAIELNPIQESEELQLVQSLGLGRQVEMIKLEQRGYKIIRRNDCGKLLGLPEKTALSGYSPEEFLGKIPFPITCKINELLKDRVFDKIFIVAPTEVSAVDPLLIGEKFTSFDKKGDGYYRERYPEDYPQRLGYRNSNFWRRDTIVALIAKWE